MPRIYPPFLSAQIQTRALSTFGPLGPTTPLHARKRFPTWSKGVPVRREAAVTDAQLEDFLSKAEAELLVTNDSSDSSKSVKGKKQDDEVKASSVSPTDSSTTSSRNATSTSTGPSNQGFPGHSSTSSRQPPFENQRPPAKPSSSAQRPKLPLSRLPFHPSNSGASASNNDAVAANSSRYRSPPPKSRTSSQIPWSRASRARTVSPRRVKRSSPVGSSSAVSSGESTEIKNKNVHLLSDPETLTLPGGLSIEVHSGFIRSTRQSRKADKEYTARFITFSRLREACSCDECIDPSTRQRTHTPNKTHVSAMSGRPTFAVATNDTQADLQVTWADGHKSSYTTKSLSELAMATPTWSWLTKSPVTRQYWVGDANLENRSISLRTRYTDLFSSESGGREADEKKLFSLLAQLQVFGIAFITGVPTSPTGNADCELRRVAEAIGQIRHTFYGETWDVRSMKDSKNVAYTNVDLGPHMDLLYFENPPRFQMLHCLRNRVSGGESYFVDAFRIASEMILRKPDTFRMLKRLHLTYEYDNDGHLYRQRHPVFPSGRLAHAETAINWSPPFLAAPIRPMLDFRESDNDYMSDIRREVEGYYALRQFDSTVNDVRNQYQVSLSEGDLVLFDNRRVLHARREFRDWTEQERIERGIEIIPEEPTRWLKGCYIDGDPVWDKLQVLMRKYHIEGRDTLLKSELNAAEGRETLEKSEPVEREDSS